MQSLLYVINGTLPAIITASGHVTSVVFSIDMSMVVLFFVLGIVLLVKISPWGYLVVFIANFKGVLYLGVLTFTSLMTNRSGAVIWISLGVISLASLILIWSGLKDQSVTAIEQAKV